MTTPTKTAFLVVLYNTELADSTTVQTLLKSHLEFNNSTLVLWNNGPSPLKDQTLEPLRQKGFEAQLRETLSNIALSKIYNDFMSSVEADKYVILDHDSKVNDEYLAEALSNRAIDIGVPVITSNGKVRSPQIYGEFENRPYTNDDPLVALGSGLILGKSIQHDFLKKYGTIFDEHYYLYGVDFTFFYRARKLGLISKVTLIPGFEHSLSRLETESEELAKFRRIERSYDFGMSVRYYPTKARLKRLVKYSIYSALGRCHLSYFHIIKALLTGKHYRAD